MTIWNLIFCNIKGLEPATGSALRRKDLGLSYHKSRLRGGSGLPNSAFCLFIWFCDGPSKLRSFVTNILHPSDIILRSILLVDLVRTITFTISNHLNRDSVTNNQFDGLPSNMRSSLSGSADHLTGQGAITIFFDFIGLLNHHFLLQFVGKARGLGRIGWILHFPILD